MPARLTASAAIVAFTLSACGGGAPGSAPAVSTPAPAAQPARVVVGADGTVNLEALQQLADNFRRKTPAEREAIAAQLDSKLERELWTISGLEAALGGPAAADEAFADHAAAMVSWARGTSRRRIVFAAYRQDGEGPSIGMGLFAGMMIVALGAEGVVTGTNDFKDGQKATGTLAEGVNLSGELSAVELVASSTHESKGVTTNLQIKIGVHPCPDMDGRFEGNAEIAVRATKTGTNIGQTGTVHVEVKGLVNDDAMLASSDADYRMEWADFAGGKGSYVDVSGSIGDTKVSGARLTRTGGARNDGLAVSAATMGMIYAALAKEKVAEAAQKGWQSGRCVRLQPAASPGPKGLEPSVTSTISAAPRSRIDGGPTGGSVTSQLTSGGASVTVSGSKVPADATFTYTAPNEKDKSGTVSLEARSRRGVAKADITLDTNAAYAYHIKGGLQDFQVNQDVCDVMKPFTLTSPGVATAKFSGGLSGTYSATGAYNLRYAGTYTITLPSGPGKPGTMSGTSSGQIAGKAGSGTERYVLTPISCK